MVTIFYPDLSQYDSMVTVEPSTVIVGARATLSSSVADTMYQTFKAEAAKVGAFFFAYHWLNHGNLAAQASWAYQHVGSVPLMLDVEDEPGNTGYAGVVTVSDILSFVDLYRRLGGTCHLLYLPAWYWSGHMGSPDLTLLGSAGLHLISSSYTTYSDSGLGWRGYGGLVPVAWQYTDVLMYGGGLVDFNAFKGDVQSFIELATGDIMSSPLQANQLFDVSQLLYEVVIGNDPITDIISADTGEVLGPIANPLVRMEKKLDALQSSLDLVVSALSTITAALQTNTTHAGTLHVSGDVTVSDQ